MRSIRVATLALTLSTGLVLSACSGETSSNGDQNTTPISVGNFVTASQLPFMVGTDQGVFESAGLDVEIVGLTSGPAGISALQNGSIHVMPLAASVAARANQTGQDVRIICGSQNGDWTSMWAQADSEIPDAGQVGDWTDVIQALRGKTIGVNALGGTDQIAVDNLLSAAGMSGEDVEYVAVGAGNRAVAALNQGEIDALYAYPFNDLIAQREGARRLFHVPSDLPAEMKDSLSAVWFSTTSWLEENPDTAAAFCEGMDMSIEFTRSTENLDAVSSIMQRDFDLGDPELALEFVEGNMEFLSTEINCESIEAMISLAVDQGGMSEGEFTDCESNVWDRAER
ncbi:ABC transporter substrate-binding protein [Dietzia lutea]|uniref:SsuA/THI5-like domain-containing protein n=1 Tax=Dietzia lutea TaxID=546160 RepID=A0A2S1R9Y6_9ACTN|nr:ABC transporter substrate-binding protein [Dietzia lutea]AWH93108.1 hypothetical protein A6035_14035 [Dietzia lutea]